MEYQNGQPLPGPAPAGAHDASAKRISRRDVTPPDAQPVILLAFGSIGLTLALADWRDWARGPVTGKARIARHLGRMLGGTIATITAAGVVNLGFLPDLVVWLGPTAIITPFIFWWTVHVTRGTAHS